MGWNDIAAEKQVGKYRVIVYHDEHEPESPREYENLGTMVCQHRSYDLGDVQAEDWTDPGKENMAVVLPLGLIDHSGISMYVGGGAHAADPGGWDSGTVGIIYATIEDVIREYGADTPENREKAEEVLRVEVEEYDRFIMGDWYGWRIEAEVPVAKCCDGCTCPTTTTVETIESCSGYLGEESAMEAAMWEAAYFAAAPQLLDRI
jgi:hypothetical protein